MISLDCCVSIFGLRDIFFFVVLMTTFLNLHIEENETDSIFANYTGIEQWKKNYEFFFFRLDPLSHIHVLSGRLEHFLE